ALERRPVFRMIRFGLNFGLLNRFSFADPIFPDDCRYVLVGVCLQNDVFAGDRLAVSSIVNDRPIESVSSSEGRHIVCLFAFGDELAELAFPLKRALDRRRCSHSAFGLPSCQKVPSLMWLADAFDEDLWLFLLRVQKSTCGK